MQIFPCNALFAFSILDIIDSFLFVHAISLQMGVHQMGIRAQLIKNIETVKEEVERAKVKAKELEVSHKWLFLSLISLLNQINDSISSMIITISILSFVIYSHLLTKVPLLKDCFPQVH